jgi:hypothetical protein
VIRAADLALLRAALPITALPPRFTTVKATACLINIAEAIWTTLLRGRVIAVKIVTATFPDDATAHALVKAATTDATYSTAAGLLGIITTVATTTSVTATLNHTAAALSGITASIKAALIRATLIRAAVFSRITASLIATSIIATATVAAVSLTTAIPIAPFGHRVPSIAIGTLRRRACCRKGCKRAQ